MIVLITNSMLLSAVNNVQANETDLLYKKTTPVAPGLFIFIRV